MAKYNVGDVLEITEDFVLECAVFSEGEQYTVSKESNLSYGLRGDRRKYRNSISLVDAHPGFRKVASKEEFKVGDKVRLLEGAHSSPGYSCDTPEKVKERLASAGLGYQAVFEVDQKADSDGDLHVFHEEKCVGLYVLPEFLVPAEEPDTQEEPLVQHMEIGETYQSTDNKLYYRVDAISGIEDVVIFTYGDEPTVKDNLGSSRYFYEIEAEFGVLPPVKPVTEEVPESAIAVATREGLAKRAAREAVQEEETQKALDELKEKLKPENSLASAVDSTEVRWEGMCAPSVPKPETISVDSLREALDFLGIQEVFDTENIISLAKRLS